MLTFIKVLYKVPIRSQQCLVDLTAVWIYKE